MKTLRRRTRKLNETDEITLREYFEAHKNELSYHLDSDLDSVQEWLDQYNSHGDVGLDETDTENSKLFKCIFDEFNDRYEGTYDCKEDFAYKYVTDYIETSYGRDVLNDNIIDDLITTADRRDDWAFVLTDLENTFDIRNLPNGNVAVFYRS